MLINKKLVFAISIAFLVIGLSCKSAQVVRDEHGTAIAMDSVATNTSLAKTLNAIEEGLGTVTPASPTPTCATTKIGGFCLDAPVINPIESFPQPFITPTPVMSELHLLFWGRVKGNEPIPAYSAYGEGARQVGLIFPGKWWPVYDSVSGPISATTGEVEGHYYGTFLTCWFEKADLDYDLASTTGTEHNWGGHDDDTHAHCWTDDGKLKAQIQPGHGVIKVIEERENLVQATLGELWVERSETIEIQEE